MNFSSFLKPGDIILTGLISTGGLKPSSRGGCEVGNGGIIICSPGTGWKWGGGNENSILPKPGIGFSWKSVAVNSSVGACWDNCCNGSSKDFLSWFSWFTLSSFKFSLVPVPGSSTLSDRFSVCLSSLWCSCWETCCSGFSCCEFWRIIGGPNEGVTCGTWFSVELIGTKPVCNGLKVINLGGFEKWFGGGICIFWANTGLTVLSNSRRGVSCTGLNGTIGGLFGGTLICRFAACKSGAFWRACICFDSSAEVWDTVSVGPTEFGCSVEDENIGWGVRFIIEFIILGFWFCNEPWFSNWVLFGFTGGICNLGFGPTVFISCWGSKLGTKECGGLVWLSISGVGDFLSL